MKLDRKSLYLQRKLKGICTHCSNSAIKGETQCNECKTRYSTQMTLRYYDKKANGFCTNCGHKKAVTGRVNCKRCLVNGSKWSIAYQQRKKESGICVLCTNKARSDRLHCVDCAEKASKRYYLKKLAYEQLAG